MKRTLTAAAIVAALIAVPTAANADPGSTITGPATVTAGDTLAVNVSGPVVITEHGTAFVPLPTANCGVVVSGSYTNGGQTVTITCTGADVLTGKPSSSFALYGADGQALIVTVNPAPVVTPPPPPAAPVIAITTSPACVGTYTVQLTNTGGADWVGGTYTNSTCTPPDFAAVALPAGATVTTRTVCVRRRCYAGVGFVVRGVNLPVGGSVVVSFVVGA